jgi:hypothetical protein
MSRELDLVAGCVAARQLCQSLLASRDGITDEVIREVSEYLKDALLHAERREKLLVEALEGSVKLQSHYAGLLNIHDGGNRMQFNGAAAWLDRLQSQKGGGQ